MSEKWRGALILLLWIVFAGIGVAASIRFVVNHIFQSGGRCNMSHECPISGGSSRVRSKETWSLAADDDRPARWSDADRYRCICSGGLDSDYSVGTAMRHNPTNFPQCFPAGVEDSICTVVVLKRETSSGAQGFWNWP